VPVPVTAVPATVPVTVVDTLPCAWMPAISMLFLMCVTTPLATANANFLHPFRASSRLSGGTVGFMIWSIES